MLVSPVVFAAVRTSALAAHGPIVSRCSVHKRRLGFSVHSRAEGAEFPSTATTPPSSTTEKSDPPPPTHPLQRLRQWFFGGPIDKERLKSLGFGALIAYGFVSNVTYGACFVFGWAGHVAATGLTPFAAGQWGGFLARVAGLALAQQFLRPLRFSAAMAITPFVDHMMGSVQNRLNVSKRTAFFVMFVSLAVVTTAGFAVALTTATVMNMPKA